ncbi:MAG: Fic family protein [Armatimonadetes bacterium]|nr:Fic family protein [Armatimonadota bacterium]
MAVRTSRAGRYMLQPQGYQAFVPEPLPPLPPVEIEPLSGILSRADQALGRLDGVSLILPNPDFFVALYVRREAVLSSQIEGTQSTLEDLLTFEADPKASRVPYDVQEVVRYVRAMNYGLGRLETLPLSLRLIREIHAELLRGVRGGTRQPGEFRKNQNWIGPPNTPIAQATFVPPPPNEMNEALNNLEQFLNAESDLPALILCGLAHAQFETIHPFLDGNGRIGRLLITFLLVRKAVLSRPLLYLSHYLKRHRDEYYARLMRVRDAGDWEGWLTFFLGGVAETAEEATRTARAIVNLRERHRASLQQSRVGANGLRLLDLLFQSPIVTVNFVTRHLDVAFVTANNLVDKLEAIGLLEETTGGRRNRRFRYAPYLALFEEKEDELPVGPVQTTASGQGAAS